MRKLKFVLLGVLMMGLIVGMIGCEAEENGDVEPDGEETVQINLAGGRVEDAWYPMAQAAADFINEESDWLQVQVISTAGLTANLEMVRDNPTEFFGILPLSTTMKFLPGHEFSDERGVYEDVTFISNATSMSQLLITHDPDVETADDLRGKTIGVGREGAGNTPDHKAILEALGILDDVNIIHGGFGGNINSLVDGLADATFTMFDHVYPDGFSRGALIEEASIRGPVRYLGFEEDMLLELRDAEHATVPIRVPAEALDPDTQPDELWAFGDLTYFGADNEMDEEIVYEITRILFETPADSWEDWHPQGAHMTDDIKPANPAPGVVDVHPGTEKYYDENDIEMKDLAELLR